MKKCKQCNNPIKGKKSHAVFCSDSCRARHWEQMKDVKPKVQPQQVLQGLGAPELLPVENFHTTQGEALRPESKPIIAPPMNISPMVNIDKPKWSLELPIIAKAETQETRKIRAHLRHADVIQRFVTIGIGLLEAGQRFEPPTPRQKSRPKWFNDSVDLDRRLMREFIDEPFDSDEWDEEPKNQNEQVQLAPYLQILKSELAKLQLLHTHFLVILSQQERQKELDKVKQTVLFESLINMNKPMVLEDKPNPIQPKQPTLLYTEPRNILEPILHTNELKTEHIGEVAQEDYIISTSELLNRHYKALSFKDKWADFFGCPAITFHCVVHGKPGEGKSTFCMQFAHYLATDFGKTIYISGEEGFGKTMQDKIRLSNASASDLFICDLRSYDDIMAKIPERVYNFIFIDSLDNLGIDAHKMKEIRKRFKDSALITISQSTKDGKMRGSQELNHDADITVSVADGIATTEKNRFLEKYREFLVFKQRQRKQQGGETKAVKSFFELRNSM